MSGYRFLFHLDSYLTFPCTTLTTTMVRLTPWLDLGRRQSQIPSPSSRYALICEDITTSCLSPHSYPFSESPLSPSKLILSAMAAPASYIRTIHIPTHPQHGPTLRQSIHNITCSPLVSTLIIHKYINIFSSNIIISNSIRKTNSSYIICKWENLLPPCQEVVFRVLQVLEGDTEQCPSTWHPLPSPTPSPSPYVKFDPFADEPLLASLVPSSQVNLISYVPNSTYSNCDYQRQTPSTYSGSDPTSPSPITIHILVAAPTEIKRYSTSSSPNRRIINFTANSTSSSSQQQQLFLRWLNHSDIESFQDPCWDPT